MIENSTCIFCCWQQDACLQSIKQLHMCLFALSTVSLSALWEPKVRKPLQGTETQFWVQLIMAIYGKNCWL